MMQSILVNLWKFENIKGLHGKSLLLNEKSTNGVLETFKK